ncbi:hypothetical protein E2C01_087170 [Portunus trituberculatus]|uniref:Transmembrane protein n=1 Tax=Portunus trituberculatus TaxID=210409 RepID=A0A5B7JGK5_PORTR|nr:hypothetical protein [Portunus trituberculatus]
MVGAGGVEVLEMVMTVAAVGVFFVWEWMVLVLALVWGRGVGAGWCAEVVGCGSYVAHITEVKAMHDLNKGCKISG